MIREKNRFALNSKDKIKKPFCTYFQTSLYFMHDRVTFNHRTWEQNNLVLLKTFDQLKIVNILTLDNSHIPSYYTVLMRLGGAGVHAFKYLRHEGAYMRALYFF